MTEHSKIADEFQKAGKDSFEAVARSYGDPSTRIIRRRRLRTALARLSNSSVQSRSSKQSKSSLSTSKRLTRPTLPR
jgi:hypothetical protein